MIYVVGYFYSVCALLFLRNVLRARWLYVFISIVPLIIALLRGNIGTDTQSYIDIIGLIDKNLDASVEIGFYWVVKFFLIFTSDGLLIIKFLSLIMFFNFLFFFSKNKERIYIYTLLVMPLFFFDMYMNGIRYGVAYSFALLAYDQKQRNNNLKFLFLLALAILFHISSIIFIALMFSNYLRLINRKSLVIIIFITSIFFIFAKDRILLKLMLYSSIESPGSLSGIMPLVIFILTIAVIAVSAKKQPILFFIMMLCCAELLSFLLSRYTYMGMRIQFVVILVLFCKLPELIFLRLQTILLLFFVSLICFAGRYRNMADEYGRGPSPYMPYHYYWDAS